MKELLKIDEFKPLQAGKVVEGEVLGVKKGTLFVSLGGFKIGRIYGAEFYKNKEKFEKLKPGDKILVKIEKIDDEDGYVELSISEATKVLNFQALKEKKEKKEVFEVKILGANRGGLLTKIGEIPAFLPVSQLLPEHYPKVEDGDKNKILKRLKKFVGKTLTVRVLNFLSNKQVILTEVSKESFIPKVEEKEAEVLGITSYGILVKVGDKEGVIPKNLGLENVKIGDKIKVKVNITGEKVDIFPSP
jgi:ribosomal protein S1